MIKPKSTMDSIAGGRKMPECVRMRMPKLSPQGFGVYGKKDNEDDRPPTVFRRNNFLICGINGQKRSRNGFGSPTTIAAESRGAFIKGEADSDDDGPSNAIFGQRQRRGLPTIQSQASTSKAKLRFPPANTYNDFCILCTQLSGSNEFADRDKVQHVRAHLRHAADLLGVEERALPEIDERLVEKCFSKKQQRPAFLRQEPEREIGVTVEIGKCVPLFGGPTVLEPVQQMDDDDLQLNVKDFAAGVFDSAADEIPVLEEEQSDELEEAEEMMVLHDPVQLDPGTSTRNSMVRPRRANAALAKRDIRRTNMEAAVQKLTEICGNNRTRTNFYLERGVRWPLFSSGGFRYRLSRVYNNGKCELRCAMVGNCKGKGVILPCGPNPFHLMMSDGHSHSPVKWYSKDNGNEATPDADPTPDGEG